MKGHVIFNPRALILSNYSKTSTREPSDQLHAAICSNLAQELIKMVTYLLENEIFHFSKLFSFVWWHGTCSNTYQSAIHMSIYLGFMDCRLIYKQTILWTYTSGGLQADLLGGPWPIPCTLCVRNSDWKWLEPLRMMSKVCALGTCPCKLQIQNMNEAKEPYRLLDMMFISLSSVL